MCGGVEHEGVARAYLSGDLRDRFIQFRGVASASSASVTRTSAYCPAPAFSISALNASASGTDPVSGGNC